MMRLEKILLNDWHVVAAADRLGQADVIQPVGPEDCIAHTFLCRIKDGLTAERVHWFMQLIFAQGKPILENQPPRRLPLCPRAETPIHADKVANLYRRWLCDYSVNYGAIPAA